MGSGGRTLHRTPLAKPPFTLGDLKRAIPPYCFQRSVLRSSYHLIHDLFFMSLFYYIATNYFNDLPYPLSYIAWPVYWICQGCILTGMWVLGHECGHNAFSSYKWLDDTVGLIIHSALLTPYFSWKISHRRHHANTSSLGHEEVNTPQFKSDMGRFAFLLNYAPIRFCALLFFVIFGWPLYLCFNISGRNYERFTSHFDPHSPIFSKAEQSQVLLSNAGVLTTIYILYSLTATKGLPWLIYMYGIPILIMFVLFMTVTYLSHTHVSVPHYDSSEWNWLRGALATIDRDFGIFNYVLHDAQNTHIVHHLFSTMPHYHAKEATEAIKPILGDYYCFDGTPMFKALWREVKECVYVESHENVKKGMFWYTNEI